MEKIVLFGASRRGKAYYNAHKNENIVYFFDNDSKKWGKDIEGIKIIEPAYLGDDYHVIIINYEHDIDMVHQLLTLGYVKFSVIFLIGQPEGILAFGIDTFDYSNYSDLCVDERKVVLISHMHSGSNTACFKYMIEEQLKDNYFKLISLDMRKKNHNFYYDIFTAKYILLESTFTNIKDKIIIQCWHGFPLKALGYMDKDVNDNAYELTHKEIINAKYILSCSKFYSLTLGACFGVPKKRFLEIGMPKNDVLCLWGGQKLLNKKIPQTVGKKNILYMPTFRHKDRDGVQKGYIFNYPDFDKKKLSSFLKENNCMLIIKAHLADTKKFEYLRNSSDNIIFLDDDDFKDCDFYAYINGTDMLITDYSSIFFDYLLLDKPIIFAHLDEKEYERDYGLLFDNLGFWCPGARIKSMEELKKEILDIINGNDCYQEKRRQMKQVVHGDYKPGDASRKLLDVMRREAGMS